MYPRGTRFSQFGTHYSVLRKRRDGCYECVITTPGDGCGYSAGTMMLFEHQQIAACLRNARHDL